MERNFIVEHKGKIYYVSYMNSDRQILGLINRDTWEIMDEEFEEICIETQNPTKKEKEQIKNNRKLANKLIKFCINHFNDYKPKLD